jgi:hypothetical protein
MVSARISPMYVPTATYILSTEKNQDTQLLHIRAGVDMTRSGLFIAGILMVSLVVSGCVEAAGKPSDAATGSDGNATGPLPGSPAASAQLTASVEPTSTVLVTPLPMLSHDEFWTGLFYGDLAFTEFPSLGALIGSSDAVAVVSIEDVVRGPTYDAGSNMREYDAYVMVHIDKVIHGTLTAEHVPVIVILSLGSDPGEAALRFVQLDVSAPKEQGILFLRNLVAWDKQLTGSTTSRYDPTVYQVLSAQGVIRNAGGVAKPALNAPGTWPGKFTGVNFGSVVSSIASTKPVK